MAALMRIAIGQRRVRIVPPENFEFRISDLFSDFGFGYVRFRNIIRLPRYQNPKSENKSEIRNPQSEIPFSSFDRKRNPEALEVAPACWTHPYARAGAARALIAYPRTATQHPRSAAVSFGRRLVC